MRNKETIIRAERAEIQLIETQLIKERVKSIISFSQDPEIIKKLEQLREKEGYSEEKIEEASLNHRDLARQNKLISEKALKPTELGPLMEAYHRFAPLFLKIEEVAASQSILLSSLLKEEWGQPDLIKICSFCLLETEAGKPLNEETIKKAISQAGKKGVLLI